MNNVNKTLYIPLYGKSYVSKKGIIIRDKKAEEIWSKEGFVLKGKSKSKWLAYYMAMRAAIYDEWVKQSADINKEAVVLHIGCGMDSRAERVSVNNSSWYDIDFPEVIQERRKYYSESKSYHMLGLDMRNDGWKSYMDCSKDAIVVIEGVSMYLKPDELKALLSGLASGFKSLSVLMDCYTVRGAKASKYKNPINDVGVTIVYGYDNPKELAETSDLVFLREHNMTPQKYIDELSGLERIVFKSLFGGRIAGSMYRMYEFGTKI